MAMYCRLVKPVSKTKLSWIARSSASAARNMSSNRWRAARMTHWLVWYALCVQSKFPSCESKSLPISNGIWVCRISSRAPRVAIIRQAQLGDRAGIFGQRDRAVVEFDQFQPTRVEFVHQPRLRQCCTDSEDGRV